MTVRVLSVFGTRPEAIKMAPVVLRLAGNDRFESRVCVTAQHREMLDQVLRLFGLAPDVDLDLMSAGQDLHELTSRLLLRLRDVFRAERPDVVLVHGDTTSCLAAALAAFYERIPVGHVEAGLRSRDLARPFPEELNRIVVDRVARQHFAPTETARANLLEEGLDPSGIFVTGNTVIDALHIARGKIAGARAGDFADALGPGVAERLERRDGRLVLVTCHRRESFGRGLASLCRAIREAARRHPDWTFVWPVHRNPNVQDAVRRELSGDDRVALVPPLEYTPFVWLMERCDLILTDSGGVQEEGPALGKPVLVTRDVTERPEAVAAGSVRLVGLDEARILSGLEDVLLDATTYRAMSSAGSPYGDGRAAERIVAALESAWTLAEVA